MINKIEKQFIIEIGYITSDNISESEIMYVVADDIIAAHTLAEEKCKKSVFDFKELKSSIFKGYWVNENKESFGKAIGLAIAGIRDERD